MALVNFSGIASGIDSAALIQSLLDQQRATRITPLQTKVTSYQETNSAFSQLKSLMSTLSDKAQTFRTLNGGVLAKQSTSSDESVVTSSASNTATNGSYDLTVTDKARNGTFSFNDRYSSSTAAINSSISDGAPAADRTVSFTIGTGDNAEDIDIELTSTSTLTDFVQQFNSSSTSATASVVNVGTTASPSYAVIINSNNEGTDRGTVTLNSVGTQLAAGGGAFQTNTLSQATDAEFTISGISGTITRSSNTISDVITGVTFNLQSTGTAKLTVSDDTSTTRGTVEDFVEAYNDVVNFIKENDLVTQEQDGAETVNIFGTLSGTSIDENILSSIRQAFSNAGISGGSVNILADLGITTERDGTLSFDGDIFDDAIATDPTSIGTIMANLGEELGAVDGTIAQYTRFNGMIDVAVNSNTTTISSMTNRIADLENSLSKQEQALTLQYSRLEGLIGRLTSQQNSLSSLLGG